MNDFISFNQLSPELKEQYILSAKLAFPLIINESELVKNCWLTIEKYFPEYQRFLIDDHNNIIGFISTVPFLWDRPLHDLPDEGWDWLIQKGIQDFENNFEPSHLGGLQIIITKAYQGKGFSKVFIAEGKRLMIEHNLQYFTIPIRPTFKHKFPAMSMHDYLNKKSEDKIYDPWIRTHLQSNASVISICNNSMNVKGDISFWETLTNQNITASGKYQVSGALNLIDIDYESNRGEYREENIWIYYE